MVITSGMAVTDYETSQQMSVKQPTNKHMYTYLHFLTYQTTHSSLNTTKAIDVMRGTCAEDLSHFSWLRDLQSKS